MKKTIRNGLFETNSSSVHTLVYKDQSLSPSRLPIKDGKVIAHFGHFGKDFEYYETQEEKLSYLLTCLTYSCGSTWDADPRERLYEDLYYRDLERVVCEYAGANGIEIINDVVPEIDHQSQPEYYGSCELFPYTEENFKNFIFNDNVMLHTDCD